MTDARISAEVVQVPMVVDPTTVAARLSQQVVQVPVVVDPTTVEARLSQQVIQIAVQVKRGYVTTFDGAPIKVWDSGLQRYVRPF